MMSIQLQDKLTLRRKLSLKTNRKEAEIVNGDYLFVNGCMKTPIRLMLLQEGIKSAK